MQDLKKNTDQDRISGSKSVYETPVVTDYGDVTCLTQQKGTIFDGTHASGSQGKGPFG